MTTTPAPQELPTNEEIEQWFRNYVSEVFLDGLAYLDANADPDIPRDWGFVKQALVASVENAFEPSKTFKTQRAMLEGFRLLLPWNPPPRHVLPK